MVARVPFYQMNKLRVYSVHLAMEVTMTTTFFAFLIDSFVKTFVSLNYFFVFEPLLLPCYSSCQILGSFWLILYFVSPSSSPSASPHPPSPCFYHFTSFSRCPAVTVFTVYQIIPTTGCHFLLFFLSTSSTYFTSFRL